MKTLVRLSGKAKSTLHECLDQLLKGESLARCWTDSFEKKIVATFQLACKLERVECGLQAFSCESLDSSVECLWSSY